MKFFFMYLKGIHVFMLIHVYLSFVSEVPLKHRKNRLSFQKPPRTKHTMYEKENLEKALEAVMSGVMTQYSASKVFNVSQPTLSRKMRWMREMDRPFVAKYGNNSK